MNVGFASHLPADDFGTYGAAVGLGGKYVLMLVFVGSGGGAPPAFGGTVPAAGGCGIWDGAGWATGAAGVALDALAVRPAAWFPAAMLARGPIPIAGTVAEVVVIGAEGGVAAGVAGVPRPANLDQSELTNDGGSPGAFSPLPIIPRPMFWFIRFWMPACSSSSGLNSHRLLP